MSRSGTDADWTKSSTEDIATDVRSGNVTAHDIARRTLDRIEARSALHAWMHIDHELVIANARAMDTSGVASHPLAGVPVGIKDLMDTFDQPTTYGSPIYAGHRPATDASIVARLRAAGALIVGKTVTTEFAYQHPGPTVNPHNPNHTPGGSSSGSAAAVADCHVPVATATQTSGSIIRPATFCGVVGFKPTYGELPSTGVKACAESLDTVGLIARSVADIAHVRSALLPPNHTPPPVTSRSTPRIGLCHTRMATRADAIALGRLEEVATRLQQAGAQVERTDLPESCESLWEDQQTLLLFEMSRNFADESLRHPESLSARMNEAITAGHAVSLDDYRRAQLAAQQSRNDVDTTFNGYDFLLTLATVGEAPVGLSFTGDPVFNSAWTLLHVPCIALPAGKGPNGLPLGVQLVGARRRDESLLHWAAWSEARLT